MKYRYFLYKNVKAKYELQIVYFQGFESYLLPIFDMESKSKTLGNDFFIGSEIVHTNSKIWQLNFKERHFEASEDIPAQFLQVN